MPYKTGSWGKQAKKRSKKRHKYFLHYRSLHVDKWKARQKVEYAVRSGKMKKLPCRDCGAKKVNAHHPDYSKPLEVIWLCPPHHRLEHQK